MCRNRKLRPAGLRIKRGEPAQTDAWEISRNVSDCAYGYGVWELVEASLCRNLLAPSGFVASLNVDAQ